MSVGTINRRAIVASRRLALGKESPAGEAGRDLLAKRPNRPSAERIWGVKIKTVLARLILA